MQLDSTIEPLDPPLRLFRGGSEFLSAICNVHVEGQKLIHNGESLAYKRRTQPSQDLQRLLQLASEGRRCQLDTTIRIVSGFNSLWHNSVQSAEVAGQAHRLATNALFVYLCFQYIGTRVRDF